LFQFGKDFARDPSIVFPVPILELCHPNVIVETFEAGLPLSSVVNRLDEMPTDSRVAVANAGVDMLLKMVGRRERILKSGNTKGGSVTVPLASCLTGLELAVWQLTILVFICKTD
jgi:hypothetical protein